jgi:hypothetical protein
MQSCGEEIKLAQSNLAIINGILGNIKEGDTEIIFINAAERTKATFLRQEIDITKEEQENKITKLEQHQAKLTERLVTALQTCATVEGEISDLVTLYREIKDNACGFIILS